MIPFVLLVENLVFPFAAAAIVIRFALSARRGVLTGLSEELRERLGGLSAEKLGRLSGRKVIWLHAASAGEVAAAAPLVALLRERPSAPAVLVTCMTAAGRERAQTLSGVDVAALAPLDCYPAVVRFLSRVRPSALLLVETELWPHLIELSARGGTRVALVNGRISSRSFPRYRLLRPLLRPFLARLSCVAAQSDEDARRFEALGARRVQVTGNLKYDALAAGDPAKARAALAKLGWEGKKLLVAGSTHPGEEEAVAAAFKRAQAAHPDLRLVLAPRHPERAAAAAATLASAGLSTAFWTGLPQAARDPDALILDVLGQLGSFYARAFVSYVGGTLVPVGGHNVLEPALAGSPVIFGPHVENTAMTARLLESAGAAFCAADAAALERLLLDLLADPERAKVQGLLARKTAATLQGAAARTMSHLEDELQAAGL